MVQGVELAVAMVRYALHWQLAAHAGALHHSTCSLSRVIGARGTAGHCAVGCGASEATCSTYAATSTFHRAQPPLNGMSRRHTLWSCGERKRFFFLLALVELCSAHDSTATNHPTNPHAPSLSPSSTHSCKYAADNKCRQCNGSRIL